MITVNARDASQLADAQVVRDVITVNARDASQLADAQASRRGQSLRSAFVHVPDPLNGGDIVTRDIYARKHGTQRMPAVTVRVTIGM